MGGFLFSRARAHTHTLTHTHTLPTNKHQRAPFNRSHRLASHLAIGSETDAFLYVKYSAQVLWRVASVSIMSHGWDGAAGLAPSQPHVMMSSLDGASGRFTAWLQETRGQGQRGDRV